MFIQKQSLHSGPWSLLLSWTWESGTFLRVSCFPWRPQAALGPFPEEMEVAQNQLPPLTSVPQLFAVAIVGDVGGGSPSLLPGSLMGCFQQRNVVIWSRVCQTLPFSYLLVWGSLRLHSPSVSSPGDRGELLVGVGHRAEPWGGMEGGLS